MKDTVFTQNNSDGKKLTSDDSVLNLCIVRQNGVAFNMQDLMLYYSDSEFDFNSPLHDVIKGMLNDA